MFYKFGRLKNRNTFAACKWENNQIRLVMSKKMLYVSPMIDVLDVEAEEGFLISGYTDSEDYWDGGEGLEMY